MTLVERARCSSWYFLATAAYLPARTRTRRSRLSGAHREREHRSARGSCASRAWRGSGGGVLFARRGERRRGEHDALLLRLQHRELHLARLDGGAAAQRLLLGAAHLPRYSRAAGELQPRCRGDDGGAAAQRLLLGAAHLEAVAVLGIDLELELLALHARRREQLLVRGLDAALDLVLGVGELLQRRREVALQDVPEGRRGKVREGERRRAKASEGERRRGRRRCRMYSWRWAAPRSTADCTRRSRLVKLVWTACSGPVKRRAMSAACSSSSAISACWLRVSSSRGSPRMK